jgi:hypothetical protein
LKFLTNVRKEHDEMKMKNYLQLGAIWFAALASARAQTTFTQITTGPIVSDTGNFVGAAWGDFHNSGFQDLILAGYYGQANVYYRNNGGGTFTKISVGDPVQDGDYHVAASAGDYDNDGNLDLVITAGAYAPAPSRNRLYHGTGDGTFSRASGGIVTNQPGQFGPGSWADYDNDGFLDLFIANHGAGDLGGKNLLFHSNGDGTFTAITNGAIVNDIGVGFCTVWQDYDNDGFVDLLVGNNESDGVNFLYRNNRNGSFTRVTNSIVATDIWAQGSAGAAFGDYDNDGLPDLFIADNAGLRNQLYHNDGNGTFSRVNSGPELLTPGANGCAWGDYDNDGYLDLFISGWGTPNALFHNNGDGTFSQVHASPGDDGGYPAAYGAVSWVDYDNDGFLDLFVGGLHGDVNTQAPGYNLLYHNNGNSNAWLEVKLVGTVANRSAIGAKVRAYATIGGKAFWQLREIQDGGSYNCPPLVAHFGLGNATNVDTLRIEWPSHQVQEIHNVAPRQIVTLTEPPRLLASRSNSVPQFALKAWPGMQFTIQSSSDLSNWTAIGSVMVTNINGIAPITDTNPPTARPRFYRAASR